MGELAEGEVLSGRYVLGPVIGHGAMGEVHLAEDIRLARPVAIKSLRPELARYPDIRQRFGQEARAAARISHPNVVRVYDSGEQDGIPFLVMECLPGSTLVDELAWGLLEPRRARQIGLDVLGALDAAHRLGVVHRDVKPGNILLSADLDGPVKVSDFGIAKSATDGSLTDSGGLVGTASYLAPERVAGEPARPESDLYSLGVVLYEGLAGRKPYEGDTSLAVALAIHMGGAPSVLELQPDLDPALADVVDRAIAQDPADRWPSAAAMAEELRAFRPRAARRARRDQPVAPVVAPIAVPTELLAADGADGADGADELEPTLLDAAPMAASSLASADGGGDDADRDDDGADAPEATAALAPVDDDPGGADAPEATAALAPHDADPAGADAPEATAALAPLPDAPAGGRPRRMVPLAAAGGAWSGRRDGRSLDDWGRDPRGAADDGAGDPGPAASRRRRTALLGAAAAAASLLLILAVATMGGSKSPDEDVPTTATTTAEVVAGPVTTPSTAVATTAAPAPARPAATTRAPRRTVAPATTARPPATRPPTTRPPATTAPPPPSTPPPTNTTPTTPTTVGGLPAAIPAT